MSSQDDARIAEPGTSPRLHVAILLAVLAGGALLCAPASIGTALAQANDTLDAEHLFRDGKRLMKEKKFAEACDAFQTSLKLDPTLSTLVNLADCREKNGQLATSWGLFVEAEHQASSDKTQKALAKLSKTRADALEPRLSYLTVSVSDESRIDGLVILRDGAEFDEGLWNRAVPVDGGDHIIAGRAPGHEEWSTTVNVPTEGGRISVDVPKFDEIKKLVEPPVDPKIEKPIEGPMATNEPPSMFTTRRKIAVATGAGGLLLFAAGGIFGMQASGLEDDAVSLCPADPCDGAAAANDLLSRAADRALLANVSYALGVGALIGATALWFTGAPERRSSTVTAAISPSFTGLVLDGSF